MELVCVGVAPLELASVPDPVPLVSDPETLNPGPWPGSWEPLVYSTEHYKVKAQTGKEIFPP